MTQEKWIRSVRGNYFKWSDVKTIESENCNFKEIVKSESYFRIKNSEGKFIFIDMDFLYVLENGKSFYFDRDKAITMNALQ